MRRWRWCSWTGDGARDGRGTGRGRGREERESLSITMMMDRDKKVESVLEALVQLDNLLRFASPSRAAKVIACQPSGTLEASVKVALSLLASRACLSPTTQLEPISHKCQIHTPVAACLCFSWWLQCNSSNFLSDNNNSSSNNNIQ